MASLALVSRDPQPLYRPTLLAPSSPQAAEATQVGDIPPISRDGPPQCQEAASRAPVSASSSAHIADRILAPQAQFTTSVYKGKWRV